MFIGNYAKVAYRNVLRNKLYSLINKPFRLFILPPTAG
jgi:hypothetical protein